RLRKRALQKIRRSAALLIVVILNMLIKPKGILHYSIVNEEISTLQISVSVEGVSITGNMFFQIQKPGSRIQQRNRADSISRRNMIDIGAWIRIDVDRQGEAVTHGGWP